MKIPDFFKFFLTMTHEINSPDNRWFTGETVGHDPSHAECWFHYMTHGGYKNLLDRWHKEHPLPAFFPVTT